MFCSRGRSATITLEADRIVLVNSLVSDAFSITQKWFSVATAGQLCGSVFFAIAEENKAVQ